MVDAQFLVDERDAGLRADNYLSPRLPLLSRTKLRLLFSAGNVLRNGLVTTGGIRLRADDRMSVQWNPATLPPVFPEQAALVVLCDDGQVTAIEKPSGMLMHATMGVKRGTLTNALLGLWNPWLRAEMLVNEQARPVVWPRFLHRLDRETSGVVLAVRDATTAATLGTLLARGKLRKQYLAILDGEFPVDSQVISQPIARVAEVAPHWRVDPGGAHATSVVTVVARSSGCTLALLEPLTGRTNQLRIHLSWSGYPILGDTAYGARESERLFLHAWRIAFPHPEPDRQTQVESSPPASFLEAWPGSWPAIHGGRPDEAG